jgi:hypothetical protein
VDSEAERDGLEARSRPHDGGVDETVRVAVLAVTVNLDVVMLVRLNRL